MAQPITAASDWPNAWPELQVIDALLRCGICYEYLNTTMMTTCSHNYCSLCIRTYMGYKTECPTCFQEHSEPQLRNNRVLDEVVNNFKNIRLKLLNVLCDANNIKCVAASPEKEMVIIDSKDVEDIMSEVPEIACPSALELESAAQENPTVMEKKRDLPELVAKIDEKPAIVEQLQQQHASSKTKAPCPVCSVEIPLKNMNHHVDLCILRQDKRESLRSNSQSECKRKHLPKLIYRLLSDKDIRKKLKELGLNNQGDRQTLIRRHHRFLILHNAECDSANPKSVAEIIQQIEKQERVLPSNKGKMSIQQRLEFTRKLSDPYIIEDQRKKYLTTNKRQYDQLIDNLKKRTKQEDTKHIEAEDSSMENYKKLENKSESKRNYAQLDEVVDSSEKSEGVPSSSTGSTITDLCRNRFDVDLNVAGPSTRSHRHTSASNIDNRVISSYWSTVASRTADSDTDDDFEITCSNPGRAFVRRAEIIDDSASESGDSIKSGTLLGAVSQNMDALYQQLISKPPLDDSGLGHSMIDTCSDGTDDEANSGRSTPVNVLPPPKIDIRKLFPIRRSDRIQTKRDVNACPRRSARIQIRKKKGK